MRLGVAFPPYEFREYPKWVELEAGRSVLVNDADEEAAIMGALPEQPGVPHPEQPRRGGRPKGSKNKPKGEAS